MHNILINSTAEPIQHPLTGQPIMPGQSYTIPDEDELKAQEDAAKAWEEAKAKEEAEAAKRAKAEKKALEQADAEAQAKREEEAKIHADLLQKQAEDQGQLGDAQ